MSRGEMAAHWFVRRDAGELSSAEEAAFQAWLAEPGNREAWQDAQRAWGVFDEVREDTHVQALRRAALAAGRESRPSRALAAAAMLLLVAGGVLALLWLRPGEAPQLAGVRVPTAAELRAAEHSDYVTALGERRDVLLPDGTTVTLNTDTALDVMYTDHERVVALRRGQAFFDVAHNAERPFVVQTPHRRVVALGTAFDVEVNLGLFQVVLVEGSVRVDHAPGSGLAAEGASREMVLAPGQALLARLGVAEQVVEIDVERELRWRQGFVEFDNEPLERAIAELNRYYPEPIVIRDPRVAQLRLSGIFRTTPREEFLSIVGEVLPVRVDSSGSGGTIELGWAGTP